MWIINNNKLVLINIFIFYCRGRDGIIVIISTITPPQVFETPPNSHHSGLRFSLKGDYTHLLRMDFSKNHRTHTQFKLVRRKIKL
jgi:hypothetical protein